MKAWATKHSFESHLDQRGKGDERYPPLGSNTDPAHSGRGHDLFVLPWGVSEEGIVFSSERLIVGNLVSAITTFGEGGIAVKSDGTYKICYLDNWVLFSVGTHTVVWDPKTQKVVHKYRPFCFAYIKAEADSTLQRLVMPSLLGIVAREHLPPPNADC